MAPKGGSLQGLSRIGKSALLPINVVPDPSLEHDPTDAQRGEMPSHIAAALNALQSAQDRPLPLSDPGASRADGTHLTHFDRAVENVWFGVQQGPRLELILPSLKDIARDPSMRLDAVALAQARAFLADPVLGDRLRDFVRTLVSQYEQKNRAPKLSQFEAEQLDVHLQLFAQASMTSGDDALFRQATAAGFNRSDLSIEQLASVSARERPELRALQTAQDQPLPPSAPGALHADGSQQTHFERAVENLLSGTQHGPRLNFILPSLKGIGGDQSLPLDTAARQQAGALLAHPVLGNRLRHFVATLVSRFESRQAPHLSRNEREQLHVHLQLFAQAAPSPHDKALFQHAVTALFKRSDLSPEQLASVAARETDEAQQRILAPSTALQQNPLATSPASEPRTRPGTHHSIAFDAHIKNHDATLQRLGIFQAVAPNFTPADGRAEGLNDRQTVVAGQMLFKKLMAQVPRPERVNLVVIGTQQGRSTALLLNYLKAKGLPVEELTVIDPRHANPESVPPWEDLLAHSLVDRVKVCHDNASFLIDAEPDDPAIHAVVNLNPSRENGVGYADVLKQTQPNGESVPYLEFRAPPGLPNSLDLKRTTGAAYLAEAGAGPSEATATAATARHAGHLWAQPPIEPQTSLRSGTARSTAKQPVGLSSLQPIPELLHAESPVEPRVAPAVSARVVVEPGDPKAKLRELVALPGWSTASRHLPVGRLSDAESLVVADAFHKRLMETRPGADSVDLLSFSTGGLRPLMVVAAALKSKGVAIRNLTTIDPDDNTGPGISLSHHFVTALLAQRVQSFSDSRAALEQLRADHLSADAVFSLDPQIDPLGHAAHTADAQLVKAEAELLEEVHGDATRLPYLQVTRERSRTGLKILDTVAADRIDHGLRPLERDIENHLRLENRTARPGQWKSAAPDRGLAADNKGTQRRAGTKVPLKQAPSKGDGVRVQWAPERARPDRADGPQKRSAVGSAEAKGLSDTGLDDPQSRTFGEYGDMTEPRNLAKWLTDPDEATALGVYEVLIGTTFRVDTYPWFHAMRDSPASGAMFRKAQQLVNEEGHRKLTLRDLDPQLADEADREAAIAAKKAQQAEIHHDEAWRAQARDWMADGGLADLMDEDERMGSSKQWRKDNAAWKSYREMRRDPALVDDVKKHMIRWQQAGADKT